MSKKQNSLSTAEAEYIAAGSCCTQLLWMKQILSDYEINRGTMTVFCDNTGAINISKNPIQHSRTKHIDIRHHFIRELVESNVVSLEHIATENQLADLFTKPLDGLRFESLRKAVGVCENILVSSDWHAPSPKIKLYVIARLDLNVIPFSICDKKEERKFLMFGDVNVSVGVLIDINKGTKASATGRDLVGYQVEFNTYIYTHRKSKVEAVGGNKKTELALRTTMEKMISIIIFLLCISSVNSNSPIAPALYVFGDSLFDSGNNNLLLTLGKANYPPYGVNFDGGATGRFTDGKTIPDLIAEFLGLPYSLPYFSLRGSPELTGLNYASATCGILPETGKSRGICLNFDEQIDLFNLTVELELFKHYKASSKVSDYLSKSLFIITIGSNDYLNYAQPQLFYAKRRYDPQSFAKLLIDKYIYIFEKLYKIGARKIIMFEIGPIGCISSVTRKINHSGKCVKKINQLAVTFNNQLATLLRSLTSTLQGSEFILGQVYWLGYDAIINPSNYGLEDSTNPCCTTWANGTSACIPGLPACHDPDKHYFWDGYHLTQAVYKVIGTRCINGTNCVPKNIKDLQRHQVNIKYAVTGIVLV
ncbi:GDSL esterase/lipase 7-like [Olea europaea var. sylvestris]|uniref:GDSL esterase/lipase 7-like n=1 Tax=Olea europaea var. sylvestris TaxID=158386 RepID=UPI000C1D3937|nr:GDSL esterase/lipase 7-like [Olea europaea var. sylvestris]